MFYAYIVLLAEQNIALAIREEKKILDAPSHVGLLYYKRLM